MKIMIVGADREMQQQLATWIPIFEDDQVIEASGMLSALWYAETQHPDLIILDLLPPDCCGQQLEELLKRNCPEILLLAHRPDSGFQNHMLQKKGFASFGMDDLPLSSMAFA